MAYESVPNRSRKHKKFCILLGLAVLVVIVVVLVIVLAVKTANSDSGLKKVVVERCEKYLKEHTDIAGVNDCKTIWGAFEQAYVGRDPCNVPPESYDLLINTVKQDVSCNSKLFWSKTYTMVHAFTVKRDCLVTVEDTLLGFLFNGLTWCSKPGSKETFTTDCPDWSSCENNPMKSFWVKSSTNFAVTACGNVSAMLNGSLDAPFNNTSIFGSIEVKNLDPIKVDSLTVLLVTKETDKTTCKNPSFQALQTTLNPNIAYKCKEVPYSRVEGCISDIEIPCGDCL